MTLVDPRRAVPVAPLLAAFVIAAAHAPGAMAQEPSQAEREKVACELEDMTRLISLRIDPDAGYVCDVLYEKPDEGGTREVLWSAKNTVDYCRPRYENLVQDLADRGWTCDYAEDASGDGSDEGSGGGNGDGNGGGSDAVAAKDARSDDDEATSQGTRGKFRDWCVTDAVNAQDFDIEGPIRGYCDCVARGMDSRGLSEEDAKLIFDGLASLSSGEGEGEITDKRLNTLTTSYREVNEFCG